MDCLTSTRIIQYIHGHVAKEVRENIGRHIQECEACRDKLREFDRIREELSGWAEVYNTRVYSAKGVMQRIEGEDERCSAVKGRNNGRPEEALSQTRTLDIVSQSIGRRKQCDNPTSAPQVQAAFAIKRTGLECDDKQTIASWVAQQFFLKDEAGIVVDGGSSCMEVWKEIVRQIELGRCAHMIVYTNSFQVLRDWYERIQNPHIRATNLELYGSSLDPDHLAFFGSQNNVADAGEKLMSADFQPSHVYIGTSGILFDKSGRILFGYHGGEKELIIKKLLFQRPADKKIILATPSKVGFASARTFNVLSFKDLSNTPVYLVTTSPPKNRPDLIRKYEEAMQAFRSPAMREAVASHEGLEFHWIIVDRDSGGVPKMTEHLAIPKDAEPILEHR